MKKLLTIVFLSIFLFANTIKDTANLIDFSYSFDRDFAKRFDDFVEKSDNIWSHTRVEKIGKNGKNTRYQTQIGAKKFINDDLIVGAYIQSMGADILDHFIVESHVFNSTESNPEKELPETPIPDVEDLVIANPILTMRLECSANLNIGMKMATKEGCNSSDETMKKNILSILNNESGYSNDPLLTAKVDKAIREIRENCKKGYYHRYNSRQCNGIRQHAGSLSSINTQINKLELRTRGYGVGSFIAYMYDRAYFLGEIFAGYYENKSKTHTTNSHPFYSLGFGGVRVFDIVEHLSIEPSLMFYADYIGKREYKNENEKLELSSNFSFNLMPKLNLRYRFSNLSLNIGARGVLELSKNAKGNYVDDYGNISEFKLLRKNRVIGDVGFLVRKNSVEYGASFSKSFGYEFDNYSFNFNLLKRF